MGRRMTLCPPHIYVVESPRDARARWERENIELKRRRYAAYCRVCGAARTYAIEEPDDDSMYSLQIWIDSGEG